jgi:hypothetical protein
MFDTPEPQSFLVVPKLEPQRDTVPAPTVPSPTTLKRFLKMANINIFTTVI